MAKSVKQLNFRLMDDKSSSEYEEIEEEEVVDTDLHVEVHKEQSSPRNSMEDSKTKPRFAISHKLSNTL